MYWESLQWSAWSSKGELLTCLKKRPLLRRQVSVREALLWSLLYPHHRTNHDWCRLVVVSMPAMSDQHLIHS